MTHYELARSHRPEKVLFSFSNDSLTKHEKYLLSRGLKFAILRNNVICTDYLLPFGVLLRYIDLWEAPNYHKKFICSRLRDCAFTCYKNPSKINENNLSKEEHLALKDLINLIKIW